MRSFADAESRTPLALMSISSTSVARAMVT
jgi:hypothetical protein